MIVWLANSLICFAVFFWSPKLPRRSPPRPPPSCRQDPRQAAAKTAAKLPRRPPPCHSESHRQATARTTAKLPRRPPPSYRQAAAKTPAKLPRRPPPCHRESRRQAAAKTTAKPPRTPLPSDREDPRQATANPTAVHATVKTTARLLTLPPYSAFVPCSLLLLPSSPSFCCSLLPLLSSTPLLCSFLFSALFLSSLPVHPSCAPAPRSFLCSFSFLSLVLHRISRQFVRVHPPCRTKSCQQPPATS